MMSNNYSKEQLLEKDEIELRSIAEENNVKHADIDDKENLVSSIIEMQATTQIPVAEAAPRRKRIAIRSTDHVYSASQTGESERFDSAKDERAAKKAAAAAAKEADDVATNALLAAEGMVAPVKRKRGRPSKEEVAMRKAMEEAQARLAELSGSEQQIEDSETSSSSVEELVDTSEKSTNVNAEQHAALPDFLRQQIEQQQQTAIETTEPQESTTKLPEFLLEQLLQSKSATETVETTSQEPMLDNLSQHFRQRNSELEIQAPIEATKVSFDIPEEVRKLMAEGNDFIIVDDIPVVDAGDFSFEVQEEDATNARKYAQEVATTSRFHRFKDDLLLQNREVARPDTAIVPQYTQEIIVDASGVLEIDQQGTGFLRSSDYNYMPSPDDVFVSQHLIHNYALKTGDVVDCKARVPRESEKFYILTEVERINGFAPSEVRDRVAFEHLTPLFPNEQFKLSSGMNSPLSCRMVDLFSPIGKGQRALIVAQPKTGKTMLMKQIANAIAANYPDTYLMMLLIDERPEEVTDMARTVNAEVIASTFDEPASRHVRIAQMVLEKAKRMVECGHDVVIFLDSITRLARAFNTVAPASGKILTGGVDANALQRPKRFFGAARNIENGGSLTIIATALIDTGSKMDEVIFEEFKGTGNMELQLDRSLANKRIFPAINLVQSSTRRDDLLQDEMTLNRMYITRNYMADMSCSEAMDFVRKRIENSVSNDEFLLTINK